MSNPARQTADGLRLLPLTQLHLKGSPLGNILDKALQKFQVAVAVPNHVGITTNREMPAVLVFPIHFETVHGVLPATPCSHLLMLLGVSKHRRGHAQTQNFLL